MSNQIYAVMSNDSKVW